MTEGRQEETAAFHPYADLFPLMDGPEFSDLIEDIRQHGLRYPIVEYEGKILDGRNRYRACIHAGVAPRFETYTGSDPLQFVISANLRRRHLKEGQRALIAARLATRPRGGQVKGQKRPISQQEAAQIFAVGQRSVKTATVVRDNAIPKLLTRVESGDVPVSVAEKVSKLGQDQQNELADLPLNVLREKMKKLERQRRMEVLASPIAHSDERRALDQKLYPVLVADPPWSFDQYSGEISQSSSRYLPMSTNQICALQPPAASDAALFLWARAAVLPDALRVMDAWGFSYRSHVVWLKDRVGPGYWFRSNHELLLLGIKGSVPAPSSGQQYKSVYSGAPTKESSKPDVFLMMVDEMFPNLPKVEMFATRRWPNWDTWGTDLAQPVAAEVC